MSDANVPLVAMIPNRDKLILSGSEDEGGIQNMVTMAEQSVQDPRWITGFAFFMDEGTWMPWLPASDHPAYNRLRLLRVQSLAKDYEEQKKLLDARHQNTGKDIWFASYSALRNNDSGEVSSYCVWSKEVDTLLPETDEVKFFVATSAAGGDVVASGSWDQVRAVVGHLMKPLGTFPERYRVKEFPTSEQLTAIAQPKSNV